MHKLLARLARRHLPEDFDAISIDKFLMALTKAFEQSDRDRLMLERSLMLTSDELNEINQKLRGQLSTLKHSQQQLEETLAVQLALFNTTPAAILNFEPNGKLIQANSAGCDIFGLTENELRENSQRKNAQAFLDKLVEPEKALGLLKKVKKNDLLVVQDHLETKQGKFLEYYSAPAVLDGKYVSRIWCFHDVTDIRKHQTRLHYQAFHDDLTGLPNRSLLSESIDHAIELAKRNGTKIAVLFIDLDDFKKINDTAGHLEGDRFLIEISRKIQETLRDSDILGRLGGDEFLVLLEGVIHQRQVINILDRILKIFSKPFKIIENQYFFSCSMGVSIYPQDGGNSEALIRKSDMAMYQAKRNGKNTYHYFDENLERIALHRVSLESQLREGISKNQFIFHFQPKINLNTREILGVEALIRWKKPSGELVFPDGFISVAEDTGLIKDLTHIVIKTACQKLDEWRCTVLANIPISINISAIDFSDTCFIKNLFHQLDVFGIKPSLIELELTESAFLEDVHQIKKSITELKKKGVLLSIDDFGTGYSSFSYLHDLDIDFLKIDKSFVQGLSKNKKLEAIVKSIIDIGENLGIDIVAEGIETIDDHNFLHKYGCHIGQGYYYSRPVPEEDLISYVNSNISKKS